MKVRTLAVLFGLLVSLNASASWFGSDSGPYDDNDWPEFTPMYWMEEMMNEFDDDDDDYYRYGPQGYGPYGYAPYGYGAPAPYAGPYGQPPVPYAGIPAPVEPQVSAQSK
jgi:hypothetical protein